MTSLFQQLFLGVINQLHFIHNRLQALACKNLAITGSLEQSKYRKLIQITSKSTCLSLYIEIKF